jgi:hypothetical protein
VEEGTLRVLWGARKISVIGVLGLVAIAGGCGNSGPEMVQVPNVTGEAADPAVHSIEHARLVANLNPEPADRSLCTVSDQDKRGQVAIHSQVTLTLHCLAVIPSVTGQPAGQAKAAILAAGGTVNWVGGGGGPYDQAACTITTQSQVGNVEPGARVTLDYSCPLTKADLQSNADSLAKKTEQSDPGETYALGACSLTSDRDGECDVTYYTPDGFTCSGTIFMTLESNNQTIDSRQDVNCQ